MSISGSPAMRGTASRLRRAALALVGLVAVTCPALASDPPGTGSLDSLSLEELGEVRVVYAASRFEQRLEDAPASVTVVTAEDIERHGWTTLTEVLSAVRGLYVTYDRNYMYTAVRGFGEPGDENRRILLLVNGHRQNETVFDFAPVGHDLPVPLEVVERIEIIRGPGSSVFGSNALLAVVNIVTRAPSALPRARADAIAASFGTRTGSAQLDLPLGREARLLLAGRLHDSEGPDLYFPEFDDGTPGGGVAAGLDEESARGLFADLRWRDLAVEAYGIRREKGIPTASYGTVFGDPATRTWDRSGSLSAQWRPALGAATRAHLRLYAARADYDGDYLYDEGTLGAPQWVLFEDLSRGRWWGAEAQVTARIRDRHVLIAGGEYRDQRREEMRAWDPSEVYTDVRRSSSVVAAYLQDDWTVSEALRVQAGLRADHYSTMGGTLNPRLAAILSPVTGAHLKLLYGRAFRAPNAFELFYAGGGNKAALELDPESVDSYEAVWEQRVGRAHDVSVSVFRFDLRHLIDQVLDPDDDQIVMRNAGHVSAQGAELGWRATFGRQAGADASLSLLRSRDEGVGQRLPNSPRHVAKARAWMPLARTGARVAIDGLWMGRRSTIGAAEVPAFLLVGASLTHHLLDGRLRLGLRVDDLFDQPWGDPGAEQHTSPVLPRDRRTWRVTVTLQP